MLASTAPFAQVDALINQGVSQLLANATASWQGGKPFGVVFKAVLNTDRATARAVSSMVSGMGRVREAADGVQESMRGIEHASGRAAHAAREWEQGGPRNFVEERNAGVNGSPGVMRQNTGPLSLVPQFQTRQELDAWWKQWQNQYAQDNPFSVKSSGALGNYQYDLTQFAVKEAGRAIDLQQAAANARPKQEAERKVMDTLGSSGGLATMTLLP